MRNMEMKVDGNTLTIKVDLTKNLGPSNSGKTNIIASSDGPAAVPGREDIKVGLNIYSKR